MMNPVYDFNEDKETVRCWTYMATHWRDEWLKRVRKHWQDFLRDVRAARRDGKAVPCPQCNAMVPRDGVWCNWRMPPCCGFCDRYIQPYPANPRNRDLFKRFIAPELEKRKITNPFL
jgi:hypothetical protein